MVKRANAKKYEILRTRYDTFRFFGYDAAFVGTRLDITYRFAIPGLSDFSPSWRFFNLVPYGAPQISACLDELIFTLGMAELISYWKCACPKNVVTCDKKLTPAQKAWWKKLYLNGLGEFFYLNGIKPQGDFLTFKTETAGKAPRAASGRAPRELDANRVLIPVGGGKDSIVTLEFLKNYIRHPFLINPRQPALDAVETAGLQGAAITARRALDENLLRLNKQGFLNGHTPFSAVVASAGVLAAYLNGIKYVALSNEKSANEPTATVRGLPVNHQYSKSREFEADFRAYEKRRVKSGVSYFSFLRPLTEIQIARSFAPLTRYHGIFLSCNAGAKENRWCAACPKCLFVFVILAPFFDYAKLTEIFGRDMLNDMSLFDCLKKLTGKKREKPFECVGSRGEAKLALSLLARKTERSGEAPPALLSEYLKRYGLKKPDFTHLTQFDENNFLPREFAAALKKGLCRAE